jgi:hypothetical protein
MVKQRSNIIASGKKRKSMNRNSINLNKNDVSINDSAWVIERPTMISF